MKPQTDPNVARTPVRRDIQGLRALAVLAVISAHAFGWPAGGIAGVDVFFVISGFLITDLLLRELAQHERISLRAFAARRVRRILPASLLLLVAVVVAAFFVFNRARADATLADAVAAALLVSNWRFAAEGTDYFAAGDAVSPLQHFWSLSVEEQFYLVWPVVLVVAVVWLPAAARRGRGGRGVVTVLAVAVAAGSLAWALSDTAANPEAAYFSTLTRAWELAAGALLACAAPALRRLPGALRAPMAWAGLAGVVASFLVVDPATSAFPVPGAVLPVAAAALLIASGVGGDPRHRHLFPLTNPVSVVVGDVSFALYLWHFPALVFAAALLPAGSAATGIALAATAIIAVTTYYLVEQPLHRSPWLRGPARTAVGSVARADAASAAARGEEPPPTRAAAPLVAPPASAPSASALTRRPAGWVPGARYYPGMARAPRPADHAAAAAGGARSPLVLGAGSQPGSDLSPPVASSSPRGPVTAASAREPEAIEAAPSPWAAWRARYRGQMGMSAAGLGIGAVVIVLLLQTSFGSPVLGPLVPPVAAATGAPVDADAAGVLQAELAEAVGATSWPDLRPSLDEVMVRSSAANPAHDCFEPGIALDAGRCTWGDRDAARHMYLVGDSTAMAYAPAFKKLAEDSGGAWRVTTVGLYGCRFTDVLVHNAGAGVMQACPQRKLDVRAMIAADPADLVVVSNAFTLGRTVDGRDLSATELAAASAAEVAAYGAAGRVVYLAPPPQGGELSSCYSPVSSPANCLTAVDGTWRAMMQASEVAAAASGDHAISSLPFSCWSDVCPAFAAGMPVRYDATHLTVGYAEHITPVLRADLAALGLY